MAKQTVVVTKTSVTRTASKSVGGSGKSGSNKCPTCGKYTEKGWKTLSEHKETKNKLKSIYEIETFKELLDRSMLNDEEKDIIYRHYCKNQELRFIGDALGYAESTMKAKHKRILKKLSKLL